MIGSILLVCRKLVTVLYFSQSVMPILFSGMSDLMEAQDFHCDVFNGDTRGLSSYIDLIRDMHCYQSSTQH